MSFFQNTRRIYLLVDFKQKEKAKSLGCKWESDVKTWYYPTTKLDDEKTLTICQEFGFESCLNGSELRKKLRYLIGNVKKVCIMCSNEIPQKDGRNRNNARQSYAKGFYCNSCTEGGKCPQCLGKIDLIECTVNCDGHD
jgi:hypothetical protein